MKAFEVGEFFVVINETFWAISQTPFLGLGLLCFLNVDSPRCRYSTDFSLLGQYSSKLEPWEVL